MEAKMLKAATCTNCSKACRLRDSRIQAGGTTTEGLTSRTSAPATVTPSLCHTLDPGQASRRNTKSWSSRASRWTSSRRSRDHPVRSTPRCSWTSCNAILRPAAESRRGPGSSSSTVRLHPARPCRGWIQSTTSPGSPRFLKRTSWRYTGRSDRSASVASGSCVRSSQERAGSSSTTWEAHCQLVRSRSTASPCSRASFSSRRESERSGRSTTGHSLSSESRKPVPHTTAAPRRIRSDFFIRPPFYSMPRGPR